MSVRRRGKKLLSALLAAAFLVCALPTFALAARLGDLDENGSLTAADARLALRAAVGLDTLTAAKRALADVDGDGEIRAADARRILRAAVGLETLGMQGESLVIDGVTVLKNGVLADGVVRVQENLYWTCSSGDLSYYESQGFTKLLRTVYGAMAETLGYDAAADAPILVRMEADGGPNTNYKGDGLRVRLREHFATEPENSRSVFLPRSVYELGHELTHVFLWAKATVGKADKTQVPYPKWNEEILCEATALYMLGKTAAKLEPGPILQYLAGYCADTYPVADDRLRGDTEMTEAAFKTLSDNYKTEWGPEVRYLYTQMTRANAAELRLLMRLYDYMTTGDRIDYDRWAAETGSAFIAAMGRIQPVITVQIDGVTVTKNGKPAAGIRQAQENLYWTCSSDDAFYTAHDFTGTLNAVYGALREMLGWDPLQQTRLLVRLEPEVGYLITDRFGSDFRIRLDDWDAADRRDYAYMVSPYYVYELGHELTHFFFWASSPEKQAAKRNGTYLEWNEEIVAEGIAVYLLERLNAAVPSPEYTCLKYRDRYLNGKYSASAGEMHTNQTYTAAEFKALSARVKQEWAPEVRCVYELLSGSGDAQIRKLAEMYKYLDPQGYIRYDRWEADGGGAFVAALKKIQPQIAG